MDGHTPDDPALRDPLTSAPWAGAPRFAATTTAVCATRRRRAGRTLSCASLLVTLAFARAAAAQTAPGAGDAGALDLARDLFRLGLAAAGDARWNDALEDFGRAYALVPEPSILFNLAAMQARTGHVRAAADSYARFLRDATGGPFADQRGAAQAGLRDAQQRVARVRVRLAAPLAPDERVLFDGAELAAAALATAVSTDPGTHVLVLERRDAVVARATARLAEGQSLDVPLDAAGATATLPSARSLALLPDGRARTRPGAHAASPWLAIGITVGAVVLGAGLATGIYLLATAGPWGTVPPLRIYTQ